MILGLFSILLDFFILNVFNYQINDSIIFPMFSLVFIISYLNIKNNIIILLIYSSLVGLLYLPLSIFLLNNYLYKNKIINNYYLRVTLLLFLFDFLLYFYLSVNDISLLIYKEFITIPINILYAFFIKRIYLSSKRKKIKYK